MAFWQNLVICRNLIGSRDLVGVAIGERVLRVLITLVPVVAPKCIGCFSAKSFTASNFFIFICTTKI